MLIKLVLYLCFCSWNVMLANYINIDWRITPFYSWQDITIEISIVSNNYTYGSSSKLVFYTISKHSIFYLYFNFIYFLIFLRTIDILSKFILFNFEILKINISEFIHSNILTLFVNSDELFYIDGEDLVIQSLYFQITNSSIQIVLNAGLNIDPFSEKLYTIELVH